MRSSANIIIIGAGIAGLGASFSLRSRGFYPIILEKNSTYGGLCGNFETLPGFRFDRFVHLSFTENDVVKEFFNKSVDDNIYVHLPNPFNLYKGIWIKHPAQNNLFPLSDDEKNAIIEGFKNRPENIDLSAIQNYEEWLRIQYGDCFAEKFPIPYTLKYWMTNPKNLETRWIGNRMYQPTLNEVIEGSKTSETPISYYAKEMRYPKCGGFKSFLSVFAKEADIRYKEEVERIDPVNKIVYTSTGNQYPYTRLISSMPLPHLISSLSIKIPYSILEAAHKLKWTSAYLVSLAIKGTIPPYLWWYIYDKDILPARVYSPSLKSKDNVPEGYSSLQLEIYCRENDYSYEDMIEKSVIPLIKLGIIHEKDILDINIRFEPWANVIFDHNLYENRKIILDYVKSIEIEPIGRFGLWDYLWSDQALSSGLKID